MFDWVLNTALLIKYLVCSEFVFYCAVETSSENIKYLLKTHINFSYLAVDVISGCTESITYRKQSKPKNHLSVQRQQQKDHKSVKYVQSHYIIDIVSVIFILAFEQLLLCLRVTQIALNYSFCVSLKHKKLCNYLSSFFLVLVHVFKQNSQSFLLMFFQIFTQDTCGQYQGYFIRHTEKKFRKKCSTNCYL